MITARALVEGNAKTRRMLPPADEPAPRSVQLYGTAPGTMYEAVRRLIDNHGVEHVDLNFGCPVPKVTRKGGGAALPVRRRLFDDIVAAAVRAAAVDDVPLTVKFRIGIDDEHHHVPRRRPDRRARRGRRRSPCTPARPSSATPGTARWAAIGELKAAVAPPSRSSATATSGAPTTPPAMVAATGCDGVVVGRGLPGPALALRRAGRTRSRAHRRCPGCARSAMVPVIGHADLLVADVGELNAMRTLRRHVGWYLQGYPVGEPCARRSGWSTTRPTSTNSSTRSTRPCVQAPGAEALPQRAAPTGPAP